MACSSGAHSEMTWSYERVCVRVFSGKNICDVDNNEVEKRTQINMDFVLWFGRMSNSDYLSAFSWRHYTLPCVHACEYTSHECEYLMLTYVQHVPFTMYIGCIYRSPGLWIMIDKWLINIFMNIHWIVRVESICFLGRPCTPMLI